MWVWVCGCGEQAQIRSLHSWWSTVKLAEIFHILFPSLSSFDKVDTTVIRKLEGWFIFLFTAMWNHQVWKLEFSNWVLRSLKNVLVFLLLEYLDWSEIRPFGAEKGIQSSWELIFWLDLKYHPKELTNKEQQQQNTPKQKTKDIHRTGRINIMKIAVLPKTIYKFIVIPIKISMPFFIFFKKNSYNFYRSQKDSQNHIELKKCCWRWS